MSKKILITGGAGFIAHHVIDKIMSTTDWEIVTLDRLDFSGNLNRLNEVVSSYKDQEKKRVKVVHHDLKAELNPEICASIGKIDLIAHLAAGSHVDRSIQYPLEFVKDNVLGTAHILDYARKCNNLERFAYFSTDEILALLPLVLIIKRMIDIIQLIHIQRAKLAEKSLLSLLKIHMDYLRLLHIR